VAGAHQPTLDRHLGCARDTFAIAENLFGCGRKLFHYTRLGLRVREALLRQEVNDGRDTSRLRESAVPSFGQFECLFYPLTIPVELTQGIGEVQLSMAHTGVFVSGIAGVAFTTIGCFHSESLNCFGLSSNRPNESDH
jgi:hypothetical protein